MAKNIDIGADLEDLEKGLIEVTAKDDRERAAGELVAVCLELVPRYPQLSVFLEYFGQWKQKHGDPLDSPQRFKDLVRNYTVRRLKVVKPQSFNMDLAGIKAAIRELIRRSVGTLSAANRYYLEEMLKAPPFKLARPASRAVEEEKYLEPEEVQALIAGCSPRIGLIVEALWQTGLRISELAGAKWSDLAPTPNGHHKLEVRGKGNKIRKVKIGAELIDRIRDVFAGGTWILEHSGKPYNTTYIWRRVRHYGERVLGRRVGPHTLRHSFATAMIDRTGNIKAVSRYLGHSDVSTTLAMYFHKAELPEEDLAELWSAVRGGPEEPARRPSRVEQLELDQ